MAYRFYNQNNIQQFSNILELWFPIRAWIKTRWSICTNDHQWELREKFFSEPENTSRKTMRVRKV